jgi:capsular polysaccharide biosynthesis protein
VETLADLKGRRELLNEEIKAAQRLRDELKNQQEMFELSLSLVQQSNYEVVEEAQLNRTPVWPDRLLIVASGLLAGLLMGTAAVFLAEASDRSLTSAEQVESYLGLPVSGVVPNIQGLKEFTAKQ